MGTKYLCSGTNDGSTFFSPTRVCGRPAGLRPWDAWVAGAWRRAGERGRRSSLDIREVAVQGLQAGGAGARAHHCAAQRPHMEPYLQLQRLAHQHRGVRRQLERLRGPLPLRHHHRRGRRRGGGLPLHLPGGAALSGAVQAQHRPGAGLQPQRGRVQGPQPAEPDEHLARAGRLPGPRVRAGAGARGLRGGRDAGDRGPEGDARARVRLVPAPEDRRPARLVRGARRGRACAGHHGGRVSRVWQEARVRALARHVRCAVAPRGGASGACRAEQALVRVLARGAARVWHAGAADAHRPRAAAFPAGTGRALSAARWPHARGRGGVGGRAAAGARRDRCGRRPPGGTSHKGGEPRCV